MPLSAAPLVSRLLLEKSTTSGLRAVIYKQEKRLPAFVWQSAVWKVLKWFFSHVQLNVFCLPFMLVTWKASWSSARAFYFVPHGLSLAVFFSGMVLPTPEMPPSSRKSSNGRADSQQHRKDE